MSWRNTATPALLCLAAGLVIAVSYRLTVSLIPGQHVESLTYLLAPYVRWAIAAPLIVAIATRNSLVLHLLGATLFILAIPGRVNATALVDLLVYGAVVSVVALGRGMEAMRRATRRRDELVHDLTSAREQLERSAIPGRLIASTLDTLEERIRTSPREAGQLIRDFAARLREVVRPDTASPRATSSAVIAESTIPHWLPTALAIALMLAAAATLLLLGGKGRFAPFTAAVRPALWFAAMFIVTRLVPDRHRTRPFVLLAAATVSAVLAEGIFFAVFVRDAVPARIAVGIIGSSLVLPLLFTLGAGLLFESRRLDRRRLLQEIANGEGERSLLAARAALLQRQLQPHFLFNALTSLAALTRFDSAAAIEMLRRLRAFFRKAAELDSRPRIPLREELDLVREYLAVEQVRFGARLQTRFDVAEETLATAVPPLLLQPLVENAVKHGVSRVAGDGVVHLSAQAVEGRVVMRILNNCRGSERGEHFGLASTRERLEQAFGGAARFLAQPADETFTVTIEVPA